MVVLSEDIIKNKIFSEIVLLAKSKHTLVVLIHPDGVQFPSPTDIATLNIDVQHIFDSIAIPLNDSYVKSCWKTISDKIFDRMVTNK